MFVSMFLFQLRIKVETAIPPESLNKSPDLKNCCVRRNFVRLRQQILNNLSLLVNSALNAKY